MGGLRQGRHVTVRVVADGTAIPARVIRVSDDVVVLDPASLAAGRDRVEPGAAVEIRWRGRRRESVVRAVVERSTGTLALRLHLERRSVQRRGYVRASTLLPLEVTSQAGSTLRGVGMDVSAVGMRARLTGPFALGDHLRVVIRLPEGDSVEVTARVVRRHSGSVAGLAFVEPSRSATERLIHFVLACQQRAIARRTRPGLPTGTGTFRRIEGGGAPGA